MRVCVCVCVRVCVFLPMCDLCLWHRLFLITMRSTALPARGYRWTSQTFQSSTDWFVLKTEAPLHALHPVCWMCVCVCHLSQCLREKGSSVYSRGLYDSHSASFASFLCLFSSFCLFACVFAHSFAYLLTAFRSPQSCPRQPARCATQAT